MRAAIMQPYFFPYLGYFQLIHAVDVFVFLDDVAFITKGWINRNKLSFNGKESWFTIPLRDRSQNRSILETRVCPENFAIWRGKFMQSLRHFYGRAPFYELGADLAQSVLFSGSENMADLAKDSIRACCRVLGLGTTLVEASNDYPAQELQKEERLADICLRIGAGEYLNAPGGAALYSKDFFVARGLELRFLRPGQLSYRAGNEERGLTLSILDAIMWCGPERVGSDFVNNYELD